MLHFLDCFIHQVKNSLYNAASLFGFPFQLTTKPMVASVASACNGTRNAAPSGEVFSNSSSCELTGSGSWNNMLKLGNKSPNGISDYPKIRVTVTRDQPRRVLPSFGFTLNSEGYNRRPGGRRHSKSNPESSLMWKPQEQVVTEMIIEEGGKGLRRPHCTVEEGVQKEEREKYRRLLERLKEGVHGNSVPPVTSTHHSSQRCHLDTLKTKGWGEEQSHGVRTTQFVPKPYRAAETRGPLCPMRSEKRCSKGRISDIEKTVGIRLENEGVKGGDTSWNLTCPKKCQPDSAWAVGAMAYSGGKCQHLTQKKKVAQAKREIKERMIFLNLQRSLRLGGGFRKARCQSRQAPSSPAFDGPRRDVSSLPQRPLLFRSTAMAQMLSSRRRWQRELSVPLAQSATPATPSPAPCASCWPNRGRSGVMDMEKEISNALGHGPQDEILSSAFKLRITRGDIQTLRNFHWLNDEVINFYMNLLMERNKKQGYPLLHAFSTFFYPKLKSGGYQAVKRWTKGVNLFEQELILVPIHRKVHWSLVVIDIRKRCLKYLDSMGQKGNRICEILLQYLQDESKTKRNVDLNLLEWTHYSLKPHEIPQQLNGSDCGMFTCKYADYMSRDKPITFTQHQMPLFRKKMVWEILHQQLL
ncbi:hypothetical protein QTO34_014623 [Cnephaeus nilssonii]|uniref:Ubiquitin-like protease family profile domain-containing protein n=1 Tax=Cnephaeus nilssonii TaxID=3371016 RepID=A0AA40I6X3_CNENI|nr:hypothetical protein QTO34_014623 [Eptesicus nilssonii]